MKDANGVKEQVTTKCAVEISTDAFKVAKSLPKRAKTTSFLRPGMRFSGLQTSASMKYKVDVRLIDVDLDSGLLTGSLTIFNLTKENPKITTFFIAEMIGPHHSFRTKNYDWGSSWSNDIQHWSRFESWRKLNFNLDQPDCSPYYANPLLEPFLYFRWKEQFPLHDPHMCNIQGASYAGFYYMCFSQSDGSFKGMYYHRHTDKYQQLSLNPLDFTPHVAFEYV